MCGLLAGDVLVLVPVPADCPPPAFPTPGVVVGTGCAVSGVVG